MERGGDEQNDYFICPDWLQVRPDSCWALTIVGVTDRWVGDADERLHECVWYAVWSTGDGTAPIWACAQAATWAWIPFPDLRATLSGKTTSPWGIQAFQLSSFKSVMKEKGLKEWHESPAWVMILLGQVHCEMC